MNIFFNTFKYKDVYYKLMTLMNCFVVFLFSVLVGRKWTFKWVENKQEIKSKETSQAKFG